MEAGEAAKIQQQELRKTPTWWNINSGIAEYGSIRETTKKRNYLLEIVRAPRRLGKGNMITVRKSEVKWRPSKNSAGG